MTRLSEGARLSPEQVQALLILYSERVDVMLAGNNELIARLYRHPDCTDGIIEVLNAWSIAMNRIYDASDAEVRRIVAGVPQTLN